jgi:GxxExxY protein
MTKRSIDELTYKINAAAIEIHKALGPGLLESVYQKCLAHEFQLRGIAYESELIIPVQYKGLQLESHIRCDFLVEKCIVIETKALEGTHAVHDAQLLTYMNQLSVPKGILFNFNCINLMQFGQKTFVNQIFAKLATE